MDWWMMRGETIVVEGVIAAWSSSMHTRHIHPIPTRLRYLPATRVLVASELQASVALPLRFHVDILALRREI